MNAPAKIRPGYWSLYDVLEINGQSFMAAVQEMRRVQTFMDATGDQEGWKVAIPAEPRPQILVAVEGIIQATHELYARAARISAFRLKMNLETNNDYTWTQLREAMVEIDSRIRDELSLVKLFAMNDQEVTYLQPGNQLLAQTVVDRFPSIMFEMEGAARCIAFGRSTASAFHSMRAVELMIRALATFLEIPDPTKPAERNWGVVLDAIKTKIDAKYTAKKRMPGSEGAKVEALYMTLDAIKNPWRNATMHAEQTYQPHEASHILQCVNMFSVRIAEVCNENGEAVPTVTELLG